MAPKLATAHPLAAEGLAPGRRDAVILELNQHLANLIDLGAAAKQAHWNVRGPNFAGLHELFDTIAGEIRDQGDDVAERVMALGGVADGTVQASVSGTQLPPFPREETDWRRLTEALADRVLQVAELLRASANELDDELATQDLYVEAIRLLEKRAWMLEAHVERG